MDKILAKILMMALSHATPGIRQALRDLSINLTAQAAKTENPWDDILAGLVSALVNMDVG